ncbi:MAG: hypothetical protein JWN14_3509 [Chthonomonadales bacterium]|nr:hypothetical protein [Chthonomonadales bacterium]
MTDLTPSPAAIVYATADLFISPPHGLSGAEAVPCTQLKVSSWELSVQLVCGTLADMMYRGWITLQIVETTKLFVIHTKNVVLHVTPGAAARMPQAGVGGWLTQSILAHDGDNVHNIVRAAYGQDYPNPFSVPVYIAMEELVALGCYADTVQEVGGLGGMLRKAVHASTTKHVPVPIPERFAEMRVSAPSVQQMLQSVSSQDPALWEMLHKQVKHAISTRTEPTDNDTSSGSSFDS